MKKIVLLCNTGLSTNLLKKEIEKVAEERNIQVEINAVASSQLEEIIENQEIAMVLIAPQLSFNLKYLQKKYEDKFPVEVIPIKAFVNKDGEVALDIIEEKLRNA